MKEVMFDEKMCNSLLKYVKPGKWYKVIKEWNLGYRIKDDSGIEDDYPKAWVVYVRYK